MIIKNYLREMRIHHYIKNFLIFLPLICSGHFFDSKNLASTIYAFLSFCFMASSIYIINDIHDVNKDKNHPIKCNRPIASGKIKIKSAIIFSIALIIVSLLIDSFCFNIYSTLLLLLYLLINVAYSYGLKNVPFLDIIILVIGFVIRILYGSIIVGVKISNWLYLVIISMSFYFGLGKRRNELKHQDNYETRNVIKKYPFEFLNNNMYMFMALTCVFYSLWTIDKSTIALYNNDDLIITVPIVIVILMKYSFDIEVNDDGDPVEVLLHDKILIILCVAYICLMVILLYLF